MCFLLKTEGKAGGYTERQEMAGAAGGPLTVKVLVGDARMGDLQPAAASQNKHSREPDRPVPTP